MRKILEKVFKNNDFNIIEYDKCDFYCSQKKSENYILYYLDNLSKGEVHYILDEKIYDNEIEFIDKEHKKNTSVIFVVKLEEFELNDEEKSIVFQIEEDPYFYKKYVLWYTENELENIDRYLENSTENIIDKELFKSMKLLMEGKEVKNSEVHSYTLLCRMFIKIPFLSLKDVYTNKNNNELQILDENIKQLMHQYDILNEKLKNNSIYSDLHENESDKFWDLIKKEIEKESDCNFTKGEFLWDIK